MLYPLFFYNQSEGNMWFKERLLCVRNGRQNRKCTLLMYIRYHLMRRDTIFNPIHYGRRLFNQYIVDNWVRIESQRADWHRNNQGQLRAENYQQLQDAVSSGDNGNIGTRIVLGPTFVNSPRYMQAAYRVYQLFSSQTFF